MFQENVFLLSELNQTATLDCIHKFQVACFVEDEILISLETSEYDVSTLSDSSQQKEGNGHQFLH